MTKSKILLSLVLILLLCSSCCFATIEPRTVEEDDPYSIMTISADEPQEISLGDDSEEILLTDEELAELYAEDDSWTNTDLYVIDDKVTVSNVVDGNAFIIGNEVTISGEIGGDLFVIANKLTIDNGYIYSSIFACANEITISGVVYDVYAVCSDFNLESNGFIYRDMRVASANIDLAGKIRRDAYITCDKINFNEEVGTIVYGDLHYSNGSEISIPEGIVEGETIYTAIDFSDDIPSIGSVILSYVSDLVQALILTLVVTLLLIWLTPKFIEKVEKMNVAKSFISLGIGVVTPLALIIFAIILMISAIGLPVLFVSAFAFVILGYIASSLTSIFFGKLFSKLLKLEGNVKFVLLTLASRLALWIICIIPILGGLVSFLSFAFGIGIVILNIFCKSEKNEKKEKKEKNK